MGCGGSTPEKTKNTSNANGLSGQHRIKVVLGGDGDVGKTSIINRFKDNTFKENEKPENTPKGTVNKKEITVDKAQVTIDLVDLAIDVEATSSDFAGAHVFVGVCDLSNSESLSNVRNFIGLANRFVQNDDFKKFVCANKTDLEAVVTDDEINDMVNRTESSKAFKVCAKTGEGIDQMFVEIAKIVLGAK